LFLSSLIETSGLSETDLLKIDIKGAEEAILSADVSGWLPRARNLCNEVHGGGCREAFAGALAGCLRLNTLWNGLWILT
jgi:hypothetical protein